MRFLEDAFTLYESLRNGEATVGHWVYIIVPHLLKTPRLAATAFPSFHDAHSFLRRELGEWQDVRRYTTDEEHQSSFGGLLRSQLQLSVDLLILSTFGCTPQYNCCINTCKTPTALPRKCIQVWFNHLGVKATLDSLDTGFRTTGCTTHECWAGY